MILCFTLCRMRASSILLTPVICTLLNLFVANVIVDHGLSGIKNGYKFEIITATPLRSPRSS